MIPKRMNFFWGGHMAWIRYLSIETFQKLNPDWEINLYYPRGMYWPNDNYSDLDYFYRVQGVNIIPWKVPVSKHLPVSMLGDLFKWTIIQEGGFYADLDILWVRPLQCPLIFDAIFCLEAGRFAAGFLSSAEDCSLYEDIYQQALKNLAAMPTDGECCANKAIYKLIKMEWKDGEKSFNKLCKLYPQYHIGRMDDRAIYQFNFWEVNRIWHHTETLHPETIGLHWYGGNPLSNKHLKEITEDNWQQFQNTFTQALKDFNLIPQS